MNKKFDIFSNKFAYDIFIQKYSMNGQESWSEMCKRVVENVCGQLLNNEEKEAARDEVSDQSY